MSPGISHYWGRRESGTDREGELGIDCLGIPVISGTPPLRFAPWSVLCRHLLGVGGLCLMVYCIVAGQGGSGPDRERKLERDCLEIPALPGRPPP